MTAYKQANQAVIQPQFTYQQNGRPAVYYAGLVDAAHRMGILAIDSTVTQLPTPDNGMVAVAKATVTMPPLEKDGMVRTFSDWGDASPENTKPHMLMHAIRMAVTRAKARALRDALNIGDVAVEELIDQPGLPLRELLELADEWEKDGVAWEKIRALYTDNVIYLVKEQRGMARDGFKRLSERREAREEPDPNAPGQEKKPATERQIKFLHAIAREAKLDEQELAAWSMELYGTTEIDQLNRRDAAILIEALQRRRSEVQ